jgi:magnesium transporter
LTENKAPEPDQPARPAKPRSGLRRSVTGIRRRSEPGAPPGTLIADPSAIRPVIHATLYSAEMISQHADCSLADLPALRNDGHVLWVDVTGLADISVIEGIGAAFGIHRLALEDVINVHQRPKAEAFEDHVFIVSRMLVPGRGTETEQVSMFLGDNYLVTFQERPGDCFDPVRARLEAGRGRIRQSGADFLAYALIDTIIDGYYPVLEHSGEAVERLEDEVIASPDAGQVDRIHTVKRDLLTLRRAIWPTREMVNGLIRDESPFMGDSTRLYLRDCYDHTIQLMDIVETYREIASGLLDVYLSSMSARMNEIMKVLTIIATIFIPLGFIAGLYGMNFDPDTSPLNMPELRAYYGYPFALGLMVAVAGGLVFYFWRKGWLSRR